MIFRHSSYGPSSLRLGPSASSSDSTTSTYSAQTDVQGASGTQSPTITAGSNVDYNDPSIANNAIQVAAQAITAALNAGPAALSTLQQLSANQAQLNAANNQTNSDLLTASVDAQNKLAAAEGTGGASITAQSTNYLIWGGLILGALGLIATLFLAFRAKKS